MDLVQRVYKEGPIPASDTWFFKEACEHSGYSERYLQEQAVKLGLWPWSLEQIAKANEGNFRKHQRQSKSLEEIESLMSKGGVSVLYPAEVIG